MKTITSKQLAYMKSGKSITPIEALNLFGCFRLGARIWEISRQGVSVKSEFITTRSGKRIKKYCID